ncbi:unnamed protein product (macronuclear) [Paramecium tetraurelia]|uniref:Uncharacterized protein n=1 Tax=Paramecium tetraurelia TaxID=5888 RepID=A0DCD1_PARTE|nr:uncharacterized protein GSPATT00015576001 [Paramecium tetraurelia]CAK80698.1 unnamed protein product [Paramecium tetraurelia]|eukprot:XP_001448095.1 hypothetical protein (macronuclear) [Paramecium tetraurelia strain d4-2]
MSLNTTMPYYRNTSREIKTVRKLYKLKQLKVPEYQVEIKQKQNKIHHLGIVKLYAQLQVNRSKRKSNNSFYDNRNVSQNENTNILQSYLANAFQEKKENLQKIQMQEIANKNKLEENKQKEIKYLMRIAALEKESSKLTEMVSKLKKENSSLKQSSNAESIILQLQEALNQQRVENQLLKKQITNLQNTHNSFNNSMQKRSEVQKSITLNTTNTVNTANTTTNTFNDIVKSKEYVPSYLLALSLAE